MRKEKVIETLKQFPDEFTVDELIERIILIEKIEKGMNDVREDKVKTLDEVKRDIRQKWLK